MDQIRLDPQDKFHPHPPLSTPQTRQQNTLPPQDKKVPAPPRDNFWNSPKWNWFNLALLPVFKHSAGQLICHFVAPQSNKPSSWVMRQKSGQQELASEIYLPQVKN